MELNGGGAERADGNFIIEPTIRRLLNAQQ